MDRRLKLEIMWPRTDSCVADIVPLEKRGAYQGYMGMAWGSAGALGPILGGILTSKANW
jgi:MFS family permease